MKKNMLIIAFVFLGLVSQTAHAKEGKLQMPTFTNMTAPLIANEFKVVVNSDTAEFVAKPGEIFTEGGDYSEMMLPYLISSNEHITYPRWAIQQGWQGQVMLAIEVLLDGTVGRYMVMESSGHKLLDETAVAAVKTWRFHPAEKAGEAIVTCVEIPVLFELKEE